MLQEITDLLTQYGLSVVGGIAFLIVGWIIAGWARRMTERLLRRTGRVDDTLRPFLAGLVRYMILVITVVAVLQQFGVEAASLIAVLGAAGLAIGLALQGTLSNVAAGVMLLFFRPFKVGDYVEAGGMAGTVKLLNLFTTELATPDNVQIIVPNSQIWGSAVTNYSFHPTRRVDFELGIGYADDIDTAITTIQAILGGDQRCLRDPPAQIVVGSLGDSAVNLIARVWCAAGDYWDLKFDLTKAFKQGFDAKGISIPFPQRDVHLYQAAAE